jgi:hypothetical protein
MSYKKVRPVSITITVQAVVDDGDTLTPVQIDPVQLTAAQYPGFDLVAELAGLESRLNGSGENSESQQ